MYERILIATDGSELAGKGLAHGLTLAAALRVPVLVVTVTEPWMPAFDDALALSADPAMQAQYREGCSRSAQRILQDAAAQGGEVVRVEGVHRRCSWKCVGGEARCAAECVLVALHHAHSPPGPEYVD